MSKKSPCSEYLEYNYSQCKTCTKTSCIIQNLITELDEVKKTVENMKPLINQHPYYSLIPSKLDDVIPIKNSSI